MHSLPHYLQLDDLKAGLPASLTLSSDAADRIGANRLYLEAIIQKGGTHYGINTGFGSLCNVRIPNADLSNLQENLVRSHACGMGEEVPADIVRLMLLLKIHGLSQGYSGVRTELVNQLVAFYNADLLPVVYELGSLGASGDLAPLAHLSLALLGDGEVYLKGRKMPAGEALQAAGLKPMTLAAKEGLALLNGTQFMSSYGTWAMLEARRLCLWADAIAALSAEGFAVKDDPFQAPIQRVRPHPGQIATAQNMLSLLQGSELQQQPKPQVQDPYSFRCIPQVHGASKDALLAIENVIEIELNSVTDNPIVFAEEDRILSGGNFHGQPLALHLDFAAIAMAELANISERRTYLLVSGQRELPPFLAPEAGINSGFMIAQYTAASIVSQNKGYCTPASVDSIVSSNGQEDHVSMGANAATKLRRVIQNVQRVLAIELLTAAQAIDFRRPGKSSQVLEGLYNRVRQVAPFMPVDRILHVDMVAVERLLDEAPPAV